MDAIRDENRAGVNCRRVACDGQYLLCSSRSTISQSDSPTGMMRLAKMADEQDRLAGIRNSLRAQQTVGYDCRYMSGKDLWPQLQ